MSQDVLSTNSEKAIAGGSLVVFVSLFLPWYGWDFNLGFGVIGSTSFNGFRGWGWLTFVALLGVVALWAIRGFFSESVEVPDVGVPDATLYLIGGALEVAGAVLFWVTSTPDAFGYFSAGAKFGIFIAIVGGALTIIGGYLKQEEPQPATAAHRSTGGGGGGGGFTPATYTPPPPPTAAPPPPSPPAAAGGQVYSAPPPPSAPAPPASSTPPRSEDPPDSPAT